MSHAKIMSILLLSVFSLLTVSCSPQTVSKEKDKVRNKNSESVGENGGEVGIDDGSKVSLPPGALAVGSEVTVQKVADDPAFAAGGESASDTVEISGKGADGVPIEQSAQPMTVALSVGSGSSLHLTLGSSDDMCVMLKTISGKQMVWRRSLLTIDDAAKKVSLQTIYFGKYKAVYCGMGIIAGFEDAGDTGATGEAPLTVSMTIPKDLFKSISHGKYCFGAVREKDDDGCSKDPAAANPCKDSLPIIAASEAFKGSADVEMTLSINAGSLTDGYKYIVGLSLLEKNASCEMAVGSDLNKTGPGDARAFFAFVVDKEQIKSGLSGVIGSGEPYNLTTVAVKIGGLGNFTGLLPHDETSVCVDIDSERGKTLQLVSFAGGKINGEVERKILAASPAPGQLDQLRMKIGADCKSFDLNFGAANLTTGKPYEFMSPASSGETIYAAPVNLNIVSTNPLLAGKNGCMTVLVPGGSNSNDKDILGRMMISFDQPSYKIYLPYLTNKSWQSANGTPKYDIEVIALKSGSCDNAYDSANQFLPAVPLKGKELSATISVNL